jgi:hypothetical protein
MKVFVYGHYDSRGGTTGIRAETREKADAKYLEAFGMHRHLPNCKPKGEYTCTAGFMWDGEDEEAMFQGVLSDFLGEVELEGDPPYGEIDNCSEGGSCEPDCPGIVVAPNEAAEWIPNDAMEGPSEDLDPSSREWSEAFERAYQEALDRGKHQNFDGFADLKEVTRLRWLPCGTPIPEGWWHPRWNDDAFSFILDRA